MGKTAEKGDDRVIIMPQKSFKIELRLVVLCSFSHDVFSALSSGVNVDPLYVLWV